MMRSGLLLAEDTPANLLNKLEMDSLENVFLNLCRKDGELDKPGSSQDDVQGNLEAGRNSVSSNGQASHVDQHLVQIKSNRLVNICCQTIKSNDSIGIATIVFKMVPNTFQYPKHNMGLSKLYKSKLT